MHKFEKYDVEKLKHWLWGWEHIPALRLLFTEDDYKRVLEILKEKEANLRA